MNTAYQIVSAVASFYTMLIFVYVIMSWFPMRGMLYDIYGVIGSVVEPWVGLFRRLIPPIAGFDFSPWAAILVIRFVIVPLLYQVISLAT